MLVVGLELGNCSRVPRVVERNLHMIVSSQFCQNPVRRIAGILGWRPAQRVGESRCHFLQGVAPASFDPVDYKVTGVQTCALLGYEPRSEEHTSELQSPCN